MGDPGLWFGLVATVIAVLTAAREIWRTRREAQREDRGDELSYLRLQIADLQRSNQLCEMRCEELREEMFDLLAKVAAGGKARRKVSSKER